MVRVFLQGHLERRLLVRVFGRRWFRCVSPFASSLRSFVDSVVRSVVSSTSLRRRRFSKYFAPQPVVDPAGLPVDAAADLDRDHAADGLPLVAGLVRTEGVLEGGGRGTVEGRMALVLKPPVLEGDSDEMWLGIPNGETRCAI